MPWHMVSWHRPPFFTVILSRQRSPLTETACKCSEFDCQQTVSWKARCCFTVSAALDPLCSKVLVADQLPDEIARPRDAFRHGFPGVTDATTELRGVDR